MDEGEDEDLRSLKAELASLRAEVRELSDRQAIIDCLHRYARGLDRFDFELLKSSFHEDARDHHGDFQGTRSEFLEFAYELLREDWDTTLHFLDVNNIEIEGDVAHSECYVFFSQRRSDGSVLDFGGGRHLDRLERRDGEWRIAARRLVIDWTASAQTAVFSDIPGYPNGTRDRTDPSYERPIEVELPGD